MAVTGWYVLYRDGPGHSVRATDGFDAAIGTAWQLHSDGRDVIQVGPRDQQRADEVIGANEIKRICARMEEETLSFRNDVAARAHDARPAQATSNGPGAPRRLGAS
jgi:hypothetical protein